MNERKIDMSLFTDKIDDENNDKKLIYILSTIIHNMCTNKQTPEFKEIVEWVKLKHPELWEDKK